MKGPASLAFPVRMRNLVFFLGLGAVAAANPAFDRWADTFAAEWVRAHPELATRTQYFTGAEQDAMDRQLSLGHMYGGVYGASAYAASAARARRGLAELERFPAATLTSEQRTSAAVIRWALEAAIKLEPNARHQFVFEQMWGYHLALVQFLTATHPVRNTRDVENYLARLALAGARLDEAAAEAKAAGEAGFLPPRFAVERVLGQLELLLAPPPAGHVLVTTLAARMRAPGTTIPEDAQARFVPAAAREVEATVLPALKRVHALLSGQLPQTTPDAGLWRLPGGGEAYAIALEFATTTRLSADEVHALGLREVARIEGEMDAVLRRLGYGEGSVKSRYDRLCADFPPLPGDDPREALLRRIEEVVREAERRAVDAFDLRPKAPVIVKREPEYSEKSAAARYTDPAPDGSLPGVYWVPLADLSPTVPWFGPALRTTAYHETIPGHHFQIALQQELSALPRYRKLGVFGAAIAYIEGWALYAERLADENGWYGDDDVGRLGYLQLQLFRARRLVADTGIHAKRWTREQTIQYGFTPPEAERYAVWPGQACAYMIGQLRIMDLRENAKAALGEAFSVKEFHNLVLGGGTMPLEVLAAEVEEWVRRKAPRPER